MPCRATTGKIPYPHNILTKHYVIDNIPRQSVAYLLSLSFIYLSSFKLHAAYSKSTLSFLLPHVYSQNPHCFTVLQVLLYSARIIMVARYVALSYRRAVVASPADESRAERAYLVLHHPFRNRKALLLLQPAHIKTFVVPGMVYL